MKFSLNVFLLLSSLQVFAIDPRLFVKDLTSVMRDKPRDETPCRVYFSLWQKDAYDNHGGRHYAYLPPHTSSFVQVVCGKKNELTFQINNGNYGTIIGQQNKETKRNLLDRVYHDSIKMSFSEARAFTEAFSQLTCSGYSDFLDIEEGKIVAGRLFAKPSFYEHVKNSLQKSFRDLGKEEFISDLENLFREEKYLEAFHLANRNFSDKESWIKFLNETWWEGIKKELSEEAKEFHACNNNAVLQFDFWKEYTSDENKGLTREASWFENRCTKGPVLFVDLDLP